jgi:branched-chain amino acid transport system permease protein
MDARRYLPLAVLTALIVALQIAVAVTGKSHYLTQITMAVIHSIVVVGLCLFVGYAGQVSLGHAGFFAIGGYASAVLTTHNLLPYADGAPVRALRALGLLVERQAGGQTILHASPWAAFAVAMVSATLVALVVGLPVIRLRGHYLAMATLGFGIIINKILLGAAVFGQADGISGVPPFPLGGPVAISGKMGFRVMNYYIIWAVAIAVMALGIDLVRSRSGRALRAIHENEDAAHSLGVNVARSKLQVFILSALLAALAGVLYVHYNGGIGPGTATAMKSVRYLAIVAAGGMANLWGALGVGVALNFMSLRGWFGSYDDAVFGVVLLLAMMLSSRRLVRLPWFRFAKGDRGHAPAAS